MSPQAWSRGEDAEAKVQYLAALKAKSYLDTANLGLGFPLARSGDRASSKSHVRSTSQEQ